MNTKEKNEFDLIDSIGQTKDAHKLFDLENNSAFAIALHQILIALYDENPNQLNERQMNLFLTMHLEIRGNHAAFLVVYKSGFLNI